MRQASIRRAAGVLAAGGALLLSLTAASAGPLDPPSGPIAPTHKTLTDVEPRTSLSQATTPGDATNVFIITQPGSYYLTANLTSPGDKNGIRIAASNVTIDLNGFALLGPGPGPRAGVVSVPALAPTNIVVRNGVVANWGAAGLDLNAGIGSLVEGVLARDNAGVGIRVGAASVVRACTSSDNDAEGIVASDACVLESSLAFNNVSHGIRLGSGSTARGCASRANSGDGFNCFGGSAVVAHCSAYGNNADGIDAVNSSVVEACVVTANNADGVRAAGNCLIRANECSFNGFGIHVVTSGDCRVEGNNVSDNVLGITIDSSGNFIVRNTCSGNTTNWSIAAGNALAPIVSASTNASPVSGNTYAGSLGSTDPNANFTY